MPLVMTHGWPGSIMPAYSFLDRPLDAEAIADDLTANARLGVPYSRDMILRAGSDLTAQLDPDGADAGFAQRYPGAVAHAPGEKGRPTELDAHRAPQRVVGDREVVDHRGQPTRVVHRRRRRHRGEGVAQQQPGR